MSEYKQRAIQLIKETSLKDSALARKLCDELNIPYSDVVRRNVCNWRKQQDLVQYCSENGIDSDNVSIYWHKSKTHSLLVKQPKIDYGSVIKGIVEGLTINELPKVNKSKCNEVALRIVISDAHVGLSTGGDKSLFSYVYNKDIFLENISHCVNSVKERWAINGCYDTLFIDDLGDGLDGFEGLTTRGGHKLEQGLSSEEQFTVFVTGKLKLIEECRNYANRIVVRNVCNDNHAGSFASIANKTIELILKRSMPEVEIINCNKFMTTFFYGDHCHVLTHGKDKEYMFKGFPLKLDPKTKSFIQDWLHHEGINSKYIHVDKGDLHQLGYDNGGRFIYRNFMSFAPPSNWVQHNFGATYCGYSIQEIPKYNGQIKHTDIFFDINGKGNRESN